MNAPERSAALARALATEPGLPEDFAARVAALAGTQARRRWSWSDVGLFAAFVAMIGVCVAGWFMFQPQERGEVEWLEPLAAALASQPWLFIGAAGIAIVQGLTFTRRATT